MNDLLRNSYQFFKKKSPDVHLYKKIKPYFTVSHQKAFSLGEGVKTIWIMSLNLQALLYRYPWIVNDLSKHYHLILRPIHLRDISFRFKKDQTITFPDLIKDITLNNFDSLAILTDMYFEKFIQSLEGSSNLNLPKIIFLSPQTQIQKWLCKSLLNSTLQSHAVFPEDLLDSDVILKSLIADEPIVQGHLKLQ